MQVCKTSTEPSKQFFNNPEFMANNLSDLNSELGRQLREIWRTGKISLRRKHIYIGLQCERRKERMKGEPLRTLGSFSRALRLESVSNVH